LPLNWRREMESQELVKGIASEVRKELFEGGAGSGNWGHKGRPGHRGGSLGGGGGKGGGISAHKAGEEKDKASGAGLGHPANFGGAKGFLSVTRQSKAKGNLPSKSAEWAAELAAFKARQKGGGSGISAHVVKPGVHASTFYDKSGGLKTSEYRKLTDSQKSAVLRHGVQKYKEEYVPKGKQGGMSAQALGTNKKVGALEGMRRAAMSKAKSEKSGSKEERASLHIAISLQQRVSQMASQLKTSGQKLGGSAKRTGAQVTGAALTAVKNAERQPGARG
jgi:hypothetical protein